MSIVEAWVQRAPVLPVTPATSGRRASPAPTGVSSPRWSTPACRLCLLLCPRFLSDFSETTSGEEYSIQWGSKPRKSRIWQRRSHWMVAALTSAYSWPRAVPDLASPSAFRLPQGSQAMGQLAWQTADGSSRRQRQSRCVPRWPGCWQYPSSCGKD
jgi:hypothetical protein